MSIEAATRTFRVAPSKLAQCTAGMPEPVQASGWMTRRDLARALRLAAPHMEQPEEAPYGGVLLRLQPGGVSVLATDRASLLRHRALATMSGAWSGVLDCEAVQALREVLSNRSAAWRNSALYEGQRHVALVASGDLLRVVTLGWSTHIVQNTVLPDAGFAPVERLVRQITDQAGDPWAHAELSGALLPPALLTRFRRLIDTGTPPLRMTVLDTPPQPKPHLYAAERMLVFSNEDTLAAMPLATVAQQVAMDGLFSYDFDVWPATQPSAGGGGL